jgi:hypothetical protein
MVWQCKTGSVLFKEGGDGSYTNGDTADRGFETPHHSTRKFIMLAYNSTENCAGYYPSLFQLVCIKIQKTQTLELETSERS